MNMSHSSTRSSLRILALAATAALTLGAFGCASQPTPPPVAAAPPSQAFQQAAGGVTAPQGAPEDGVQFVEQERKEPSTHDNDAPATGLHADVSAHPKH
jgi:hypothetical protein